MWLGSMWLDLMRVHCGRAFAGSRNTLVLLSGPCSPRAFSVGLQTPRQPVKKPHEGDQPCNVPGRLSSY